MFVYKKNVGTYLLKIRGTRINSYCLESTVRENGFIRIES